MGNIEIRQAITDSNTQKALKIIENNNCYPDYTDAEGNTLLIFACEKKLNMVANSFINKYKNKCKPEQINNDGNTALIIACQNKMIDVIINLIGVFGVKCNPAHPNKYGVTALTCAINNGMIDIATLLLNKFGNKCNIGYIDYVGSSAIIDAIKLKQPALVKKILEIGDSDIITKLDDKNLQMVANFINDPQNDFSNELKRIVKEPITYFKVGKYVKKIEDAIIDYNLIPERTTNWEEYKAIHLISDWIRYKKDKELDRDKNAENEPTLECCICYSGIAEPIALKPCMHISVCSKCVNNLKECPLCKTKILAKTRCYI